MADSSSLQGPSLLALNPGAMRRLFLALVEDTDAAKERFHRLQAKATAYHPQRPETGRGVNEEVSQILGSPVTLNDAQLGALRELFFEPRFSHLAPWPAPTAVW